MAMVCQDGRWGGGDMMQATTEASGGAPFAIHHYRDRSRRSADGIHYDASQRQRGDASLHHSTTSSEGSFARSMGESIDGRASAHRRMRLSRRADAARRRSLFMAAAPRTRFFVYLFLPVIYDAKFITPLRQNLMFMCCQ